jgi:DNA-binding CsgD family transcriptional regulator
VLVALRGFAQGDTAEEVAAAYGLSAEGLSGLLSQVWEAARRRRQRYAPSPREREVLALVVQGYTHKEVATRLGISAAWLADVLEYIRDKYTALHPEANQAIAPLAAAHRWASELGIE